MSAKIDFKILFDSLEDLRKILPNGFRFLDEDDAALVASKLLEIEDIRALILKKLLESFIERGINIGG